MNLAFANEARMERKKISPVKVVRMRLLGHKIYLDHEIREGWTGHLPFYLFWCGYCGNYAKDYPHGFIERRYLLCSFCGMNHDFTPWWIQIRMIYGVLALRWRYRTFIRREK